VPSWRLSTSLLAWHGRTAGYVIAWALQEAAKGSRNVCRITKNKGNIGNIIV